MWGGHEGGSKTFNGAVLGFFQEPREARGEGRLEEKEAHKVGQVGSGQDL